MTNKDDIWKVICEAEKLLHDLIPLIEWNPGGKWTKKRLDMKVRMETCYDKLMELKKHSAEWRGLCG